MPTKKPQFYECGCCGCYHPANWDGDCRDDANRFAADQLDEKYGPDGWEEVDQPDVEDPTPQRFLPGGVTGPFRHGAEDESEEAERDVVVDETYDQNS